MSCSSLRRAAALALPLVVSPACTLVAIDSQSGPPGVRADGLIEGHAAFGIRDEHQFLHVDLFDGTSSGAIFELRLWKLARLELGLAGAAVGIGPVDLALGCLFYEPEIPRMVHRHRHEKHVHGSKYGVRHHLPRFAPCARESCRTPSRMVRIVEDGA